MAQLINEAKRMQFLAGLITESQLNEEVINFKDKDEYGEFLMNGTKKLEGSKVKLKIYDTFSMSDPDAKEFSGFIIASGLKRITGQAGSDLTYDCTLVDNGGYTTMEPLKGKKIQLTIPNTTGGKGGFRCEDPKVGGLFKVETLEILGAPAAQPQQESQLNEALNKDIRQFGNDVMKRLQQAGFEVEFGFHNDLSHTNTGTEIRKKIEDNPKYIYLSVNLSPYAEQMSVSANAKSKKEVDNVVNKFQTSTRNGVEKIIRPGGMFAGPAVIKQVVGALNPGDIYSWGWGQYGNMIVKDYLRHANVTSSTKTTEKGGMGDDKVTYSQGTTKSLQPQQESQLNEDKLELNNKARQLYSLFKKAGATPLIMTSGKNFASPDVKKYNVSIIVTNNNELMVGIKGDKATAEKYSSLVAKQFPDLELKGDIKIGQGWGGEQDSHADLVLVQKTTKKGGTVNPNQRPNAPKPSPQPQQESLDIDAVVNEALTKFRKNGK